MNPLKIYYANNTLIFYNSYEARSWRFPSSRVSQNVNKSSCKPARNIVFLKTHKTGSSTLQNIFLRYALKYV